MAEEITEEEDHGKIKPVTDEAPRMYRHYCFMLRLLMCRDNFLWATVAISAR